MSERHLLIRRHRNAYLLEATHGADRVELATFELIEDARAAARIIRSATQMPLVDRSGAE